MTQPLLMLTIPGLRRGDLATMPGSRSFLEGGAQCQLRHSFPSVTWPAQATHLTGCRPREHGIVANGFFWRNEHRVEMWTMENSVIQKPQIWDSVKQRDSSIVTAAWFPMLSKKARADIVAMPAPIHKTDGSEELWCYSQPETLYGELLTQLGHFPLHHFWGPLANIKSTEWICRSAAIAAKLYQPSFFYVYLPHLDYAAQKHGPDSPEAVNATLELDNVLTTLVREMEIAYGTTQLKWVLFSEYVIEPVSHVSFPNRILREAGLLTIENDSQGQEVIDFRNSEAWALVDHQFAHIFLKNPTPLSVDRVVRAFQGQPGIQQVLHGLQLASVGMDHDRSGDVLLISNPDSWMAYYWWFDDTRAPNFARTVDIHRKPGYDPVELFFDPVTRAIPLNANLIRGSHGVVTERTVEKAVFATKGCRQPLPQTLNDTEICDWVINEICN